MTPAHVTSMFIHAHSVKVYTIMTQNLKRITPETLVFFPPKHVDHLSASGVIVGLKKQRFCCNLKATTARKAEATDLL